MKLFRLLVRNDFYAKLTVRKGWIRQVNSEWNEVEYPNLRYAEGCHKYPETVSAALLDDHSKAVSLHIKSLRSDLPMVR